MNIKSTSTKIVFATFSPWKNGRRLPTNGNVEPMLDFLIPKTKKLVLIDQPYPGSDHLSPRYEIYTRHFKKSVNPSVWFYWLNPFLKVVNTGDKTHISFKIRDFISVFDYFTKDKTKFDFLVGLESINTLAGIMLRRLGRVKWVIYYVSDYSPKRYAQKWFNTLYIWLDRFCSMHADYIWDVSKAIHPARISAGLNPALSAPVIHVPNALYRSQIKQEKLADVIPFSLVFMGTLGILNGPEIAIEALPYLLHKFPKVRLHIVGGYDGDIQRLKLFVAKLKLGDYVVFHGFIADRNQVSQLIRKFSVALATYPAAVGSKRFYGDSTKIRAYLAAGLPIVTTYVPPLGQEIAAKGAAIMVKDNPEAVAAAVSALFSDKKLFIRLRKKSIQYAKENTWENEFKKAFAYMDIISGGS